MGGLQPLQQGPRRRRDEGVQQPARGDPPHPAADRQRPGGSAHRHRVCTQEENSRVRASQGRAGVAEKECEILTR